MTSHKGKLLVATPTLVDPNFHRTVVLLLEHNDEGAAGVVLNRPTDAELGGPLERWAPLAARPPVVFVGGPVQPDAAVCVASATIDVDGFTPAFARLGTFDLSKPPDGATGLDRIRVFAGYAGWDEGQLEDEIEQGAWYVLDADPEDAFTTVPDDLWRFVLRRQGGDLSVVANFPIDPSMN